MSMFRNVVVIAAVILASGCTSNAKVHDLEARVAAAEAQLIVASTANAKAQATADAAMAESSQALSTANDAVEAVSRMAEKCCRK